MDANLTYTVNVPVSDKNILLSLAKRMGWTAQRKTGQRICRLDEAIRAAKEDTLFETNDINILMQSLNE
ncbi:MAG: hypothetical protein PUC85_09750 [bacterium]|nr:hypothetical protein [bacterium]